MNKHDWGSVRWTFWMVGLIIIIRYYLQLAFQEQITQKVMHFAMRRPCSKPYAKTPHKLKFPLLDFGEFQWQHLARPTRKQFLN